MAPDVDNDRDGFQRSNMRPAGSRLHRAMQQLLQNQQMRLQTLCTKLHALSPLQVLARGYALVYQQEQVVESIDQIQPGDHLVIQLQDGTIPVQALEKGEHHDI